MKRVRRGLRSPFAPAGRPLLISGAVIPTIVGSALIAALALWGLPTGTALAQQHVLRFNIVVALCYCAVSLPCASICGYLWMSLPAGASDATARRVVLAIPRRMAVVHGAVWSTASVVFVLINLGTPWLAATLGVSMILGAIVTTALSYWMCKIALRPTTAKLLTDHPPTQPQGPGLRLRAMSAWLIGTGAPLLMGILVAASALAVDYPAHRLALTVLVLDSCTVACGLVVAAFNGSAIADPIDEVTRGMQTVRRGDFDVSVPVFDASELGLLQAGFNTMATGLRERERLRDLFGRHVGHEVARLAEQLAAGDQIEMGGVNREVAVLFVDLVGSTRLAATVEPPELLETLNKFFAVVVNVVERNSGLINKFEGDAALAIFGAPFEDADSAAHALATARELNALLNPPGAPIRAGIGVSAGMAVAGNVGHPGRYEYTVIGDPVNEAARLTEIAKLSAGVAVSAAAVVMANQEESRRWRVIDSKVLRGRTTSTDIAVPLD
ncbi:adenylate/guanylate cyclase domain-containing protein [Mycobacterium sp. Marseille-P9652]|uniref:adenylate/guanylate cyclase domain-containing protein n=1 Tax=Mycobacterium sp. Marseille-P9652 TaxID=2654950 RepID=UPI0018D02543|nr:adenylate/guanylate cyclase domain-containing protein [Mycobacterium sp. Marseille-P9652]